MKDKFVTQRAAKEFTNSLQELLSEKLVSFSDVFSPLCMDLKPQLQNKTLPNSARVFSQFSLAEVSPLSVKTTRSASYFVAPLLLSLSLLCVYSHESESCIWSPI